MIQRELTKAGSYLTYAGMGVGEVSEEGESTDRCAMNVKGFLDPQSGLGEE
jgi:hypothetical protein